jgi:hypothetical protein
MSVGGSESESEGVKIIVAKWVREVKQLPSWEA